MSDSPWRNREALKRLYIDKRLTTYEIADKWGCSDVTISNWLSRHDIPARNPNPPTMNGEDNPRHIKRDAIIDDYKQLAEKLGKTPSQLEYNNHGEYTWGAVQGHFEGMGELQDAAGLERLEKGRVGVVCVWCGDKYNVKYAKKEATSFCSSQCSAEWKQEHYTGAGNPYDYNDIEITCEECESVVDEPHSLDQRFCSQECMNSWRGRKYSGENHPRWNEDFDRTSRRGWRGPNWNEQREKARERDNHECQECGNDEQLNVHHIIPWKSFDDDNYKEANKVKNLITLCVRCHLRVEHGSIAVQTDLFQYSS